MAGGPEAAWQVLIVCTANQCRSPMAQLLLARRLAAGGLGGSPGGDQGGGPGASPGGGPGGLPAVRVASAGTRTVDGRPVTPQTAAQLALRGLDAQGFRSRSLTDDMVRRADLVLTATRAHRSRVLERVPLALRRTFTLLEFAAIAPGLAGGSGAGSGAGGAGNAGGAGGAGSAAAGRHPGPSDLTDLVRRTAAARAAAGLAEYDVPDPVGGPDAGFAAAADTIEQAVDRIAAVLLAASRR